MFSSIGVDRICLFSALLIQREAEENLPSLSDKEGIQVVMRDAFSEQFWTLKFKWVPYTLAFVFSSFGLSLKLLLDDKSSVFWLLRYWSNNKSRMYVLENTGRFHLMMKFLSHDLIFLHVLSESFLPGSRISHF